MRSRLTISNQMEPVTQLAIMLSNLMVTVIDDADAIIIGIC